MNSRLKPVMHGDAKRCICAALALKNPAFSMVWGVMHFCSTVFYVFHDKKATKMNYSACCKWQESSCERCISTKK